MTLTNIRSGLNKGFTLLETVISIAVLSILMGITTPALFDFIERRDIREEQRQLFEIEKAMRAYVDANLDLPPDDNNTFSGDWADELAQFSSLSADQIQFNVWGQGRQYVQYLEVQNLLGTDVSMTFATVFSSGPNQIAEQRDVNDGIAVGAGPAGERYRRADHSQWWSNFPNMNNGLLAFRQLEPVGDDMMVKYTDAKQKIDAYHLTLKRMREMGEALESYSRRHFTQAMLIAQQANPDNSVAANPRLFTDNYYPRSQPQNVADLANYSPTVLAEMAAIFSGNTFITVGGDTALNDNARRTEMIELARLLGLPDSYCCSALSRIDGGPSDGLEMPFFYFSNPRPRTAGGCGPRPNPVMDIATGIITGGAYIPPRLVLERVDSQVAPDRTCG